MPQEDGINTLKKALKTLPQKPGVYRMFGQGDEVLYVGKAINIQKRVTQYTQTTRLTRRIRQMVYLTRRLEVVETPSETEALLLEANLIKNLQPRYNIRLKDDGTYPGIYITPPTDKLPSLIRVHRGKIPKKGWFFGPYPSGYSARRMVDLLERLFKLRTCTDGFYRGRKRPCLKYHIGRCSAPCVDKVSREDYGQQVQDAVMFLEGRMQDVQKRLQDKMAKAVARQDFEAAAIQRDRLSLLAEAVTRTSSASTDMQDADVVALVLQGGRAAAQIFSYRHGQHIGNSRYFPDQMDDLNPQEAMEGFLALYYTHKTPPKFVLTNTDLPDGSALNEALSQEKGQKVQVYKPQRGEKRTIVQQAELNADQALKRRQAEHKHQREMLRELAEKLEFDQEISRIECFDVSNIQGREPVASMVVMTREGIAKDQLRKFAIKSKQTPDDYAMMAEVLTRRYKRLFKEHKDSPKEVNVWPQVVMVDGGKGHLRVLEKVFEDLAIDPQSMGIVLCAIAKGEERDKGLERIFCSGKPAPLPIDYNTPLIFMLQRLRDESHRVAIGYHRQKRSKKLKTSLLDTIPNIGPKRKKALLNYFGSVPQLKRAAAEDIAKVEGISKTLAREIYDYING